MITFTHATTICVPFGEHTDDHEVEVLLTVGFTPGRPSTGPTYASGGDPPEDPEIELHGFEIMENSIWRKPSLPLDLALISAVDAWIAEHEDELIGAASEEMDEREYAAMESRAEFRAEMRAEFHAEWTRR
jgi:hypothetical protein